MDKFEISIPLSGVQLDCFNWMLRVCFEENGVKYFDAIASSLVINQDNLWLLEHIVKTNKKSELQVPVSIAMNLPVVISSFSNLIDGLAGFMQPL